MHGGGAVALACLALLAAAGVAVADPSPPHDFAGGVSGNVDDPLSDGAIPSNERRSTNPVHYNEHPITIPAGENERMTIRVSWENPSGNDWDLLVFRDTNGDGRAQVDEPLEGSSEQDGGAAEEVEVGGLVPGGRYVARVLNFAAHEAYSGTVTYLDPLRVAVAKREGGPYRTHIQASMNPGQSKRFWFRVRNTGEASLQLSFDDAETSDSAGYRTTWFKQNVNISSEVEGDGVAFRIRPGRTMYFEARQTARPAPGPVEACLAGRASYPMATSDLVSVAINGAVCTI